MFDILNSPLFALFCTYLLKRSTKCVDICIKAETPYFSFLKKNSEAMKHFWFQNCDSSHQINFCPTNAFSAPLLCQTNSRNFPPTIKYPSISVLKGIKCGQKEVELCYIRGSFVPQRGAVDNDSEHPQGPPDHLSGTKELWYVSFSVLFFWLKFEYLHYFIKQFLLFLPFRKLISLACGFSPRLSKLKITPTNQFWN